MVVVGFARAVRRRGQFGAGQFVDLAAAGVRPAGDPARFDLRHPRAARRLGHAPGRSASPRSRCCGRSPSRDPLRISRGRPRPARSATGSTPRSRYARGPADGDPGRARRRDRGGPPGRRRAALLVLRRALPSDRAEHVGPHRRAPGRRARLAQRDPRPVRRPGAPDAIRTSWSARSSWPPRPSCTAAPTLLDERASDAGRARRAAAPRCSAAVRRRWKAGDDRSLPLDRAGQLARTELPGAGDELRGLGDRRRTST